MEILISSTIDNEAYKAAEKIREKLKANLTKFIAVLTAVNGGIKYGDFDMSAAIEIKWPELLSIKSLHIEPIDETTAFICIQFYITAFVDGSSSVLYVGNCAKWENGNITFDSRWSAPDNGHGAATAVSVFRVFKSE